MLIYQKVPCGGFESANSNPPCHAMPTVRPCNATPTVPPCNATPTVRPCNATPTVPPCNATPTVRPCNAMLTVPPCNAMPTVRPCNATPTVPVTPCNAMPCGRRPGMVYAAPQDFTQLDAIMSALACGTLFKELQLPLTPYGACGNGGSQEQAIRFVLWEIRLYLDTHPNDQAALSAYQQLAGQVGLPADPGSAGPFPWELAANTCAREGEGHVCL